MSNLEKELVKATGVTQKRGEDRQDFLDDIVAAVHKLDEAAWDDLSKPAKKWFNDCADVKQRNRDARKANPASTLEDFPDIPDDAPEKATRRASKDTDEGVMKVGSNVTITTKRGREHKGRVLVIEADYILLETEKGEQEISNDSIAEKVIHMGNAPEKDAEPEDFMVVGAVVTVTNSRGKVATGKITEIDDEIIALDTDDGPVDFNRGRVTSVQPAGGKAVKPAKKDDDVEAIRNRGAGTTREERKAVEEDKAEKATEKGKITKAENDGVSIGAMVKEMIADNLDDSVEEIIKKLNKAKVVFKDQTVKLNYVEAHKLIGYLRAKKLLK